jgi:GAF domain-containing protein
MACEEERERGSSRQSSSRPPQTLSTGRRRGRPGGGRLFGLQTLAAPSAILAQRRAAMSREVAQIEDAWTDSLYEQKAAVKISGGRSMIGVPLMREGEPIGVIGLARTRVDPFAQREIDLVTTFADQAVIAIENTRLLNELRQRTDDLSESLQQQTATADVLKVISRSTFDLQSVLNTLIESASRLCKAEMAAITNQDGDTLRLAASYWDSPELSDYMAQHPIPPGRGSIAGRVLLEGHTVHVPDVMADPEYEYKEGATAGGVGTMLGVPLLRESSPIGVLVLLRRARSPFTEKEIELAESFADQAVIAIENVRLFEAEQQRTRELTESLDQQTATSEVLQVISSSPGELQPVFATMLENAVQVCKATFGNIFRWDGEWGYLVATRNTPPAFAEYRQRSPHYYPDPKTGVGRMSRRKRRFRSLMLRRSRLT